MNMRLEAARARRREDLSRMAADCRDLVDPAYYPVSLGQGLRTLADRVFAGMGDGDGHRG